MKRFGDFLPGADYPLRAGVHSNTAFALLLARDYAEAAAEHRLSTLLRDKAMAWYEADVDCQAWEPSGDEFLSTALVEAALMRRMLSADYFDAWSRGSCRD